MRLWTLHPGYLDSRGLVALWREGLLARKVLLGQTRGYRVHPQLVRFRSYAEPLATIDAYLWEVVEEARCRGYRFDETKLEARVEVSHLIATTGQLAYEWSHLMRKLRERDPERAARQAAVERPLSHPNFVIEEGAVADWERQRER